MTLPYAQRFEDLMGEHRRQLAHLAETQRKAREISSTATAPKRAVEVTVNFAGEVTEISFPTKAYRTMPPVELAALLVKTIGEARTKAITSVAELMAPMLPTGISTDDVLNQETDWVARLTAEPPGPEAVADLIERRFGLGPEKKENE